MKQVLQLKTSLFADHGVSNQLAGDFLSSLERRSPGWQLSTRDFNDQPIPHLDADWLRALSSPAAERSSEQARQLAYSDAVIAEVQTADLLLIGAPMYNFSLPSMLKAWFDHLARAGVTFRYTDKGPEGLLTGKRVVVIASMGGRHQAGATDHLRPYLRTMLGFLGLRDVEFIVADGLNLGAEAREAGLQNARRQIARVVAKLQVRATERSAA